jgi:hypothetical protein
MTRPRTCEVCGVPIRTTFRAFGYREYRCPSGHYFASSKTLLREILEAAHLLREIHQRGGGEA